jgi:transaldolase
MPTASAMPIRQTRIDAIPTWRVQPGDQVTTKYDEARQVMADLAKLGVDYDDVIATLEREGVEKFVASWDELVETVKGQLEGAKQ